MKKVKHLVLSLISATLVTASLFSCNSEEESNVKSQVNNESNNSSTVTTSSIDPEDNSFEYELSKRYSTFELGERVVIVDDENEYFVLKEAIISSVLKVYVFFNLQTNEIESIVDVNKETLKMRIEDFSNNEILSYDNISTIEGLVDSNYNLIEIGQNYKTSGIPILGGDRFWGWACGMEFNDGGTCAVLCSYNVLGTRTTPTNKMKRPCNEKPESFKRKHEMIPQGMDPWID